ncbi:MAG: GNAT family N-acetyltransferase [Rhodospirillaceae bacterium]
MTTAGLDLDFRVDDLTGADVQDLILAHLTQMRSQTPPESVHALDLSGLRAADVTFWSVWDGCDLVACGALKKIYAGHGENKSMHTRAHRRGRGIGQATLNHILAEARTRGYRKLSLETGRSEPFAPATAMYTRAGFVPCGPIGDCTDDPFSAYFTLDLLPAG